MKHSSLCFAGAVAALLAAAELGALPIDNRINPDGTPVLLPAVQKYQPREGTTALPKVCRSGTWVLGTISEVALSVGPPRCR